MKEFSVLMSIYKNTKPSEFDECFESLDNQTVKAAEYIVVIDGQINESLELKLAMLKDKYDNIITVPLEKNVGLGLALREGMKHCKYELIARMDTDDICEQTRFEKQLDCFDKDAELSVVGSNIVEFIDSIDNIVSYRKVPENHAEICEFLKKRCPFNHMTVMFKKSEVEKAGGYLDWHYNEDSYLWARMYLAGCKFANIPEVLVDVRIDQNTFLRRGGLKYFKSERDLFKFMNKNGIISKYDYLKAITIRFIVYVMLPNSLRQWAFKVFARESHENV